MNPSRPVGALWLASLAAAVPAQAQPAAAETSAAEALVEQVMARMGPAPRGNAEPGPELGLFRRMAQQQASARKPTTRGTTVTQAQPLVPALAWAMEQLDPVSFAVLRPVPVGGSGALLRTGDVFVLQFSTNLPGQVKLENVDPKGQVADLGTYTVLVDQLNRLPRDRGIQLQGQPGLERLRFYFFPCLPAEASGKAWAAEFAGKLPACGGAPVQAAGASSQWGTVAPRALVNLAQPDGHVALAGSTDYQPGDLTLMEAHIRHLGPLGHEGRSHGR